MSRPARAAWLLALAGLAWLATHAACGPGEPTAEVRGEAPGAALRADARIADLLYPCPKSEHYDRDLSDLLPVLLEKLEIGETDPLHRAKEELAARGSEAMPGVRRLLERYYADPMGFGPLQNAIDVASLSRAPEARDLLLLALEHPREAMRTSALRAMDAERALPQDYDVLRRHVDFEVPRLRAEFAASLFAADPERAALEVVGWTEGEAYADVWPAVLPLVVDAQSARADERCRALWREALPAAQLVLAAAAARAGDGEALALLVGELEGVPERRALALRLLGAIERADALVLVLRHEADAGLRLLAAQVLATLGPTREIDQALRAGMQDASAEVRSVCTGALVARGDGAAVDLALLGLDGSLERLQASVVALRPALLADADLARRAFERLERRMRDEAHLPWSAKTATAQALGQVPARAAASLLYALAQGESGAIGGLPAHRWLVMQVANTGAVGRALLSERLPAEDDPIRRIDLVWALASDRGADVREALLSVAEDEARDPYERLFAADRLTLVGPSEAVAPRLKRVCLRIQQADVRLALQCLLWRWY